MGDDLDPWGPGKRGMLIGFAAGVVLAVVMWWLIG